MTTYSSVFGGANIYPSEISYSAIALTGNITLSWPTETSSSVNLATRIIDVTPSIAGLSITLPDAQKAGVGETILFNNNQSSQTFIVRKANGTQVVSLAPGELWQVYLTNNSSAAGEWESLQYGATTSNANASALAGTGIVAVGALLSQSVPISSISTNETLVIGDRAKMFNWLSSGAGTITLPSSSSLVGGAEGWFVYFRNSGGGAIVIDPQGADLINLGSSLSLQPDDSAIVAFDSASSNFYTIGLGKDPVFAFDYTSIAVPGTGNYTLGAASSSELNRISYTFTGALTGNRTIIVPTTVQQYWVGNSTTGGFNFTVKTAAGVGVNIGAGTRRILYCNGTDVLVADLNASSLSVPVLVSQGGTGAVSSGAALISLGGGATGISLFQTSTTALAYGVLGVAPSGIVNGGTF